MFLTQLPEQQPQQAAIKLISADATEGELWLSRWELTESLSHPNLIRLHRTGRCQVGGTDLVFAVMEYAEENLGQIIPGRQLTLAETREMLEPTLDALAYLHGQGLVHGRLKPANIMAINDRLALASDHICRAGDSIPALAKPDVYSPPESTNGVASPAADVWSLGVTLVEVLTQYPPSRNPNDGDPVLAAGLPAPFMEIVRGCLRRDPASRWTIADIKVHLHPPSPLPPKPVTLQPTAVRPRVVMPAIVTAIVVTVLLAGWGLFHGNHSEGSKGQAVPQTTAEQKPNPPANIAPVASGSKSKPSPVASARSAKPSSPQPAAPPTASSHSIAKNEVVHQVLPDVPETARDTIQGTIRVSVKVQVDPSGNVTGSELDSAGPSKYFARLALQAAQGWKFVPEAQAASREFILRFEFTNNETKSSAARVSH